MKISLRQVETKKDLKAFISFPFDHYKGNPYWVPPLIQSEMTQFSAADNPVFEHSDAVLFTAWKDGRMQGRIAGIINHLETAHLGEQHGRFGWLEFTDEPEISRALLEGVENWAREKGCKLLKGPHGFNQLDKNGMLTAGFDSLGTSTAAFNYPYYAGHLEALGFEKDLEWVELTFAWPGAVPDKVLRMKKLLESRYGLRVLKPSGKEELRRFFKSLFDLLQDTYIKLPGFVPISEKQSKVYVDQYIRFMRLDFVHIVLDDKGQPIGFGVSLPSFAKALQKAKGRLFPFGFIHLLKARWRNDTAELALIGVREEWRQKGVHSIVFAETGDAFEKAGISRILGNPMLEFNNNVLSLWKEFDPAIHRRRRTYRKLL
ncbi:MAG: hypothetical protein RI973_1552 [Bacteroidota bacterium]|jgi:GNAT superfamily N-acetyltransferase